MTGHRDLVLGTAGHIDHGKTALVRALTGVDTDRLPAEKQRGITIDLGFATLEVGENHLALIDVPGHERFIRNMLAGATGLDLVLLVVAADDSVMPQTREHLEILRLLGLSGGVVALTKCDLVGSGWLEMVEDEVRTLVAGTFLEGAALVRTSASTGLGIDELKQTLRRLADASPDRNDPGLFRMAIDRVFTVAGHGTVVTGTVASGSVGVGDELEWFPEGRAVRVRGLHRHNQPIDRVGRGARAAVNLVGVHHTEVQRGHELGAQGYLKASRVLSVEIRTAHDAQRPFRHRERYRLHVGTAEVTATLSLLEGNLLGPGNPAALGQLFLAGPVAVVHGQPFVLRQESPSATLGGGQVLQPTARRIRRHNGAAIERLGRLRSADPVERVAAVLAVRGLAPWVEADLCREAGLALREIPTVVGGLSASGALVELPLGPRRSVRVPSETAAELEDRVTRALGRLHASRPRQAAVCRDHLVAALPDIANEVLIGGILSRLQAQGKVVCGGRSVALRGHKSKLSQGEQRLRAEMTSAFRAGGLSPPDATDLAALAGPRATVVPELLSLLVDEGELADLGGGLFLDRDCEAEMRRRVIGRLADGSQITMAELRDLLGTTRKYAVPFGEYLDRVGVTVREGDSRRLDPSAGSFPDLREERILS
jgi:selenocysteine-specific elongation factor